MRQLSLLLVFSFLLMGCYAQRTPGSENKKALTAFNKALESLNNKKFKDALEHTEKAIEEDENFVDAHLLAGQLYEDLGQYNQAIVAYEKTVELNPDFRSECYWRLGMLYFGADDFVKSAENLRTYLSKPKRKPTLEEPAKRLLANAEFAAEAIAHPQPFNPVNLGSAINSEMGEYYPCLTGDDNTLYYTRRLIDNTSGQGFQEDFYVAKKVNEKWEASKNLGSPINTPDHNEGAPTISADGRTMVFVVCEAYGTMDYGNSREGFGSCDLFIAYKEGNSWIKPHNLGELVNSYAWETQPSLSSDGRTLYFIRGFRNKTTEITGQDIWFTTRGDDGKWQQAKKVEGLINTGGQESSVAIHPDGYTLYFSSDGHPGFGGEDIFVSYRKGQEWSKPLNLGYPINSKGDENSLTVAATGEVAYFASDRPGGLGNLDLYSFVLPENVRPMKVSYVKGLVTSAKTNLPLEAEFRLIDLETKEVVVASKSDKVQGDFLVTLPVNKDYALNVSKDGYLFHSENFSLKESKSINEPRELNIALHPIEKGEVVVLRNVFFDTDKFDLKPESEVELDKLHDFLLKNPALKIELGGHTDNQGDDAYNQLLSENRAKSVMQYLVSKGLDVSRLSSFGYGETKPVDTNETPEGRAKNRRTEFKVL